MKMPWLLAIMAASSAAFAQDPEFPKGEFIMHLRMHGGMVSNFHGNTPDLFAGGLQVIPQYTIIENRIRGGIVGDVFYTGKKFQAAIGPTISLKISTLQLKQFGSGGNLHLSFDHLWGTGGQRLLGGGINLDLLNKLVIGLSVHRDYALPSWWLQGGVSFRISKVKQPPHP